MSHRFHLTLALLVAAALSPGCRAVAPGFKNQAGTYEDPDVVVPALAARPAPIPRELPCPGGRLTVYAADVEIVPNCQNAGPAFARTIGNAASRAAAYAQNRVTCKPDCTKQISLIWLGWDCRVGNPTTATAAVELLVECVPPAPPKPGEVTP